MPHRITALLEEIWAEIAHEQGKAIEELRPGLWDSLPAADAHKLLQRAAETTAGTRTQRLRSLIG